MSGRTARIHAITAVTNYQPISAPMSFAETSVGDLFGSNVFNRKVMKASLPPAIYESVTSTIERGERLDPSIADIVASAMKDWAIEKGATHYAHVFYPLTGLTAEKHDGFLTPDGKGGAIAEFLGKALIQGEPDASSFPHGGIRATFEARGYTAWDVTSPAYILENPNGTTLCIPTAFVSWTGEALDKKTPVLRSIQALDQQARRVLNVFGHENPGMVLPTAGPEQEYFLIDRNFYFARPDLLNAGRTLFGAASPKGQEFEDHYFGAIPDRVLAFMLEAERELYKLGIPIKTRHNEVAPAQYEIAPIFETANIATDHQQMVMMTLKRVAEKYGMACLLHEKPFAGINGSGKHVNYSIGCPGLGNLLDPGETPHENAQFLVFCAAIIRAVHKYSDLLRAVVASAGNDHRLGTHEAPPVIMSIFLGDQLTEVFEQIKNGATACRKKPDPLTVGVDTLPPLPKDAGDRNRTSPMAFTGNRFEFRAVGSHQSIAGPLVAMNTIIAEALDEAATELEKATAEDPAQLHQAVQAYLKRTYTEHGAVVFNGDNYCEAWAKESAKRGLPNLETAVDAIATLNRPEIIELFGKYNVLSRRELESRQEIYFEQYRKEIALEARLMLEMGRTIIFPAAVRYQGELASTAASLQAIGVTSETTTLPKLTQLISRLETGLNELETSIQNRPTHSSSVAARYYLERVIPIMAEVRDAGDRLEEIVADDLWDLPTFQEMLFIK